MSFLKIRTITTNTEQMEKQTKAHIAHQIASIQMTATPGDYSKDFEETETELNTSFNQLEEIEAKESLTLEEKRVFSNVLRQKIRKCILRLAIFLQNDAQVARIIKSIPVNYQVVTK